MRQFPEVCAPIGHKMSPMFVLPVQSLAKVSSRAAEHWNSREGKKVPGEAPAARRIHQSFHCKAQTQAAKTRGHGKVNLLTLNQMLVFLH
ncbi:hypothetical protein AGIG_G17334 [Arapaima gigas]